MDIARQEEEVVMVCEECAEFTEFSPEAFKAHFKSEHGVDLTTTQATTGETLHVDYTNGYLWLYEMSAGGKHFCKKVQHFVTGKP
jgi:hypothetical protein